MSTQIIALIFVVFSFTLLFAWAFWPANKARFEAQARLALDSENTSVATPEGEKS